MRPSLRAALVHFAQGLLMGGADIIPGVSGGTMALIVGIYERLIAAISTLFSAALALVRADVRGFRTALRDVEWRLILPLGLGIVTALVLGARIIPYFLEHYPMQSRGLFFGLIAGSLVIPWLRVGRVDAKLALIALAGAAAAFYLVGLPPAEVIRPTLLQVFASAAVAICAMILPGVSGAFLLYVLGIYAATLHALNSLDVPYVLVFVLGAAVGLGLFSKLLDFLLTRWHDATMAALVGLMAGSLRALWPWIEADRSLRLPAEADPVLSVVLLAAFGLAFVLALVAWSRRIEGPATSPASPSRHG